MTRARGFRPLRDLPALLWLLATVVVAFVHPFVPAPRWLMVHLLLLGAVTNGVTATVSPALLTSTDAKTLPVMVASQTGSQGINWWAMAARANSLVNVNISCCHVLNL